MLTNLELLFGLYLASTGSAMSRFVEAAKPLARQNKLSSAKFLVWFNFQSALMSLKFGENVVLVSKSLDPDETPSYSITSCLHMALWL